MNEQASKRTKILIAEDHAPVRQMLKRFCAGQADELFECSNGEEAVAAYATLRPDWVLMDINMPGMNGIEALACIKTAFPEARIVMVTQVKSSATRQAALDAGACAYVLKDNLEELRVILSAQQGAKS
jgi:DNA-binding NarL/FixJ family response regulator